MRHPALFLILVALLTSCQAHAPSATSTAAPSAQQTAAPSVLFFDGFDMLDAHSGWAWQGISRLFRTDDGGATWAEIHLTGKMLAAGAAFLSSKEAWLPGPGDANLTQAVYHTVDGGKTWTTLGHVRGPNAMLYFHDPKLGWATNGIGATGNVFYQVSQTVDGGQTWTQWQAASPGQMSQQGVPGSVHTSTGDSLAFTALDTIWLASGHDISTPYVGLSVSRDSGKTWTDINPRLPASDIAGQPPVNAAVPEFISASDAYLPVTVGSHLVFLASHDGGATWRVLSQVAASSPAVPRVQFVNASDGFAVCASALCVTRDGAQTWEHIATPFAFDASQAGSYVVQFDFVDANTGWAIVADPGGQVLFVKTTDGGRTWIDLKPHLGF